MITESTISKLAELHLMKMAEMLRKFETDCTYNDLSFEEKMGMIVDAEWAAKMSLKQVRLRKAAKFSLPEACAEDIRYEPGRHLDKNLILRLMTGTYLQEAMNVIIFGATGTGKTYLSCALGNSAISNYYSVKYIRLPDLCIELDEARANGTLTKVLKAYKKVNLLIIDEWLSFPLTIGNTRELVSILDARYMHGSTIMCSQFSVEGWFQKIGDPVYADAICDRTIHNAYRIELSGESMRKICHSVKKEP